MTSAPEPRDPNPSYLQPPYAAQPPYGAVSPQYWNQPGPGYGYPAYGYPYPPAGAPFPPTQGRPGSVLAASILGYISAGILFLAAMLLFFGASIISSVADVDSTADSAVREVVIDGFVNLVSGGLLLAGGVVLTAGRGVGRILLTVGAGVCVAAGIYWLVRSQTAGTFPLVLVFAAPAVASLILAWLPDVSRWLKASTQIV